MKKEIVKTQKGEITVYSDIEVPISNASDFLDLLANTSTKTIALDKKYFDNRFYELNSGLAGEILQKVSNYRRSVIIIGDFTNINKKSLKDFIYESNKTGQVVFAKNMEEGISLLK